MTKNTLLSWLPRAWAVCSPFNHVLIFESQLCAGESIILANEFQGDCCQGYFLVVPGTVTWGMNTAKSGFENRSLMSGALSLLSIRFLKRPWLIFFLKQTLLSFCKVTSKLYKSDFVHKCSQRNCVKPHIHKPTEQKTGQTYCWQQHPSLVKYPVAMRHIQSTVW